MLKALREAKFAEIDRDTCRQKAAADYIVGLIEVDEPLFRQVFADDEPAQDDDTADLRLYERVNGTLEYLTNEHVWGRRTVRITRKEARALPAAQLGWATYEPLLQDDDQLSPNTRAMRMSRLTRRGVAVINGLRAALELPSLSEQREINRAYQTPAQAAFLTAQKL